MTKRIPCPQCEGSGKRWTRFNTGGANVLVTEGRTVPIKNVRITVHADCPTCQGAKFVSREVNLDWDMRMRAVRS